MAAYHAGDTATGRARIPNNETSCGSCDRAARARRTCHADDDTPPTIAAGALDDDLGRRVVLRRTSLTHSERTSFAGCVQCPLGTAGPLDAMSGNAGSGSRYRAAGAARPRTWNNRRRSHGQRRSVLNVGPPEGEQLGTQEFNGALGHAADPFAVGIGVPAQPPKDHLRLLTRSRVEIARNT